MSRLKNDLQLLEIMKEMKFTDLKPITGLDIELQKLFLIYQILEAYENTDQDTVEFAPEFVIVVRRILQGQKPVKLVYLEDFQDLIAEY